MRIGFDFDNTIVNYDSIFHKIALEQGVIDVNVPVNKTAVRDYLRLHQKEDIWTKLQGYVYGARMLEAESYPQVLTVMQKLKQLGHELVIISHKTKTPYLGEPYDLHAAARQWLNHKLTIKNQDKVEVTIIDQQDIYFEVTKNSKFARIAQLNCDIFIDDLPEILLDEEFPFFTKRFLFDPDNHHASQAFPRITRFSNWDHFESYL